jgi:amidase
MNYQDGCAVETVDCCYESASSLLGKMAEGIVSSEELVKQFIVRRNRLNPVINAIVTTCDEQALGHARAADEARARGELSGPLHGLPMTVKDTWETRDILTTSGSRLHHNHLPSSHADTIERLTNAGAIIIGKTNVPVMAADIQTFNPLFGLTRNPWHTAHTCGGSSGGAAAALAAGLTPVEIGSDIGGSIRIPAHFCGVYGHKPTRDIVSLRGHIPGPPGTWSQPDLAEAGPLARSVDDLELMLDVLAGPRAIDSPHWGLALPPPSFSDLRGLRIGYWFDDPACPLDEQLAGHYHSLVGKLQAAGAKVVDVRSIQSRLLNMELILPLYFNLLGSMIGLGMPAGERFRMKLLALIMPLLLRHRLTLGIREFAMGINQSFRRWLHHNEMREKLRFESLDLFSGIDILLIPVTPTVAIPHDLSMPIARRRIRVNNHLRPYSDQFVWIALATMLGLPATVAPAGLTREGLPFGIQIVSGFGRDRSTLQFARLLEPLTGGCQAQELVSESLQRSGACLNQ